ncbi:aspartyl protease AED1-like [Lycium barbarum]|uniref:aspartyl protease AED1-like n=1 Tax=Lycium barbarum TaxID=112863 RepID=UPI00293F4359|nr:aspartyl protease AED1-like [Lycium barbarum]
MAWRYKHIPTCFFLMYYLTVVTILGETLSATAHSQVKPKPNCQRSSSGPIIESHNSERVSRFEPCSPNANQMKTPPSGKHLNRNQTRDRSKNKKLNRQRYGNSPLDNGLDQIDSDYGWFTVTISLGTPQQNYNLIADTGSHLTWVRCQPCFQGCTSNDPLYDPSKSLCKDTISDPFNVTYADNSFTKGIWGCDTLTIDDLGRIMNFNFGCGQENVERDNFVGAAGILGLGKGEFSLTSQSDASIQMFSYFVPENSHDGNLHFGDKARNIFNTCNSNQFTPLVEGDDPVKYYLDLVGISVDGNKLDVSSTKFTSGGTIIDSGTIITRLPQEVYTALSGAIRQSMSNYTSLEHVDGLLDTCYHLEGNEPFVLPEIKFHFGEESTIDVTLSNSGTIWKKNDTVNCLAFAATESINSNSIISIVQQRGINVLYDLEGERIGFGRSCAS